MKNKGRQSEPLSKGSSPRRSGEGAKPTNGSKPTHVMKPPTSGPSGGAGDSGASKK